jgi:hypothetical protein
MGIAIMSDHPSSETPVSTPGSEAISCPPDVEETEAAPPPGLTFPPGCWIMPEKLPFYPDRKFGDHLDQCAPIHHENNGWLWPDKVRARHIDPVTIHRAYAAHPSPSSPSRTS